MNHDIFINYIERIQDKIRSPLPVITLLFVDGIMRET